MLRRIAAAAALATAIAATPVVAQQATALSGRPADATFADDSGTSCDTRVTYTPFTAWGDTNPYYLMNGGDFEDPATLWSGTGADGYAENEPWRVGGDADSTSARLAGTGAQLSSPVLCVRSSEPTLRFFYRAPGINGSKLVVTMRTSSMNGTSKRTLRLDGSVRGWQLTPPLTIADLTDRTGTQRFTVDFTSGGGEWLIDDIYVDPWKFRID